MTIAELRAYLDEYAATFDETVKTRIDSERFLAWLDKRMAQNSGEAATAVEVQAAIAEMTPSAESPLQAMVSTEPAESLTRLWDGPLVPADSYQPSAPAAEGANA